MPHALAVDDDPNFLTSLVELIEGEGFSTHAATSLRDARERALHRPPDVALVALRLPDGSGLDLLRDLDHGAQVILIATDADVDSAVAALRLGAADYLTKPLDVGRLRALLTAVARAEEPAHADGATLESAREQGRLGPLIGASPGMLDVYAKLLRVAVTDATVLVTGASGTGKDLAARTLHQLSRRAEGPLLALNCGSLSPTLIESELFGHERGSFTGASRRHKGCFERAHGGTLFLDEIAEMPLKLQVKLLRVLESGTLMRIGGDQPVAIDVRVVAATHRDPHTAIADRRLREDLYYRLAVFPLAMPPLRERGDDVQLLAEHFLAALGEEAGTPKALQPDSLDRLRAHPWPGNVRELKNAVHRAFILADGDRIPPAALPPEIGGGAVGRRSLHFRVGVSIAEVERELILATLEGYDGNKRKTADVLGVSLKTLYNRLNTYKDDDAG
jgi:two-component system, NtrC family, response regulator HydG